MKKAPLISIIIPCRNELNYIGNCLDSLIDSNFAMDRVEILVVDGRSDDGTGEVISEYENNYSFIRHLDNPNRTTPAAINIGIRESSSGYVLILGAHSRVDTAFLKKNIESFELYPVDCIGGIIKTRPMGSSSLARSISLALSHPFGVGNALFRIGAIGPKFVDTVPFGCYKREVFDRIGYFDEELVRNQDDEINHRLTKNGGKILLVPEIVSYYYARDSLLKLWKMYYQYGYFKPLAAIKAGGVSTWRQLMPSILIVSILLSALISIIFGPAIIVLLSITLIYISANAAFSFSLAIRNGLRLFLFLPIVFVTLHFSYGIGYLKGLFDFLIMHRRKNPNKDVSLTR